MRNRTFGTMAIAVVAIVAVVSSGFASATHVFTDVEDDEFFSEAVEWAAGNGMTTGSPAGSDTFKPFDPVTRGENITFAKRYDDFVVQPALAERLTVEQMIGMWDHATGAAHTVTALTDTAIAGASTEVTIPEGRTAYVELTFIGESNCFGGTGTLIFLIFFGPWCEVKFYDDGGEIFGSSVAFDSVDKDSNADTVGDETLHSWEGRAISYVDGPLEAGTYTYTAYSGANGATAPTFTVGDWSFTAEVRLDS